LILNYGFEHKNNLSIAKTQICSSNGKLVTSIEQEDSNRLGGTNKILPSYLTSAKTPWENIFSLQKN